MVTLNAGGNCFYHPPMSNLREPIFGWSFPLFTVSGIAVRVHWLFVAMMAWWLYPFKSGWSMKAAFLGIVFGSVLLHEFGHALACRSVGGRANRILLWPLGGLAECTPPPHPLASLWTTLCGPGVNLVLMAVAACVLAWQQMDAHLPMPISLDPRHILLPFAEYASPLAKWMGIVYQINYVLFLFNMAFPCYPMDAGRVVQEVLWLFVGYARSLWWAAHIGLAMAVVMLICSLMEKFGMGQMTTYIAIFCLLGGWQLRQRVVAMRQHFGSLEAIPDPQHQAQVGGWLGRWLAQRENNNATTGGPPEAGGKARANPEAIERILCKVREHGLAALTPEELAMLRDGQ